MVARLFLPGALLLVAISLALLSTSGCAEPPEPNLIRNADFGDGMNGWTLLNYGEGGTTAIDPAELRNGKPTLRIESPGELMLVHQTVKVKPHTTYLLSADIKVKDVHEEGGSGIGGALVMMGQSQYGSRSPHGTADWQRVTTQLETGDKTEIEVGPAIGWWKCKVTGTGWFSDVSLTELKAGPPAGRDAPERNLIVNSNFERRDYGWELINFGKNGTVAVDPAVLHDGKPSLRIDSFGDMTFARQVIPVKAHTAYRLSGYVKVKDVHEIGGARKAGANFILGSTQVATRAVSGTQDWQEISVDFDTQDKTVIRVGPAVGFYGDKITGTAWFSDLWLIELKESPRGQ